MKKEDSLFGLSGVLMLFLFTIALLIQPTLVEANAKAVAVEGAVYNVNISLTDNLKIFVGKKVYVTLTSGTTLAGVIKDIGTHLVHLQELDGKDFNDALIRLENIVAIDTRFREYQR